jgi:hypothetical protein
MINRLILLLLLVCLTPLLAIAQQVSVQGHWRVEWTDMVSAMTASEQNSFTNFPEAVQQKARESFDGREYFFNADGSATVSWRGRSESGTWQHQDDQLIITMHDREQRYTVLRQGNQLILSVQTTSASSVFSTLVLTSVE